MFQLLKFTATVLLCLYCIRMASVGLITSGQSLHDKYDRWNVQDSRKLGLSIFSLLFAIYMSLGGLVDLWLNGILAHICLVELEVNENCQNHRRKYFHHTYRKTSSNEFRRSTARSKV